jgi:hypothetical protein
VTNLEELKKLAPPAELRRAPVVEGNPGPRLADGQAHRVCRGKTPLWWWVLFLPAAFCAAVVFPTMPVLSGFTGVGVWGNNHPVMWGWTSSISSGGSASRTPAR